MLQARVLLCLSLAAVQVWAQGDAGTGSNQNSTLSTEPFQCWQRNPWWTYMNDTTGDACHIALQMRKNAGLGSLPTDAPDSILRHPDSPQLCLPVVYDMYGACLACKEPSPPETSMVPSYADWCNQTTAALDPATTQKIEDLAPAWTKKVDFTGGTWDIKQVQAAAAQPPSTSGLAPPSPTTTTTSGSGGQTVGNPSDASSHKSSNIGPIVGGIIGGLALISIGAAVLFFYLRRQRSRKVAPSSEFTKYIQPGGTQMSTRPETALSGRSGTIPRQDSATIPLTAGEDEVLEAPPVFTPGQYTGPIFEKDGYRADPNAPLFNSASQPSHSQSSPQGPSGSAV